MVSGVKMWLVQAGSNSCKQPVSRPLPPSAENKQHGIPASDEAMSCARGYLSLKKAPGSHRTMVGEVRIGCLTTSTD